MKAKLLAGLLVVLAAASLLVAVQRMAAPRSQGAEAPGTLRIEVSLTPVLSLYVNGKLVHSGVDPATRNFQLLLAYLLAGSTRRPQITDTSGNSFTASWDPYHSPITQSASIAFGTGSQPFTRDVYKLVSEMYSTYASYAEGYNSTHAWIALSAVYSSTSSVTITEVGLKVQVYDGSNWRWVLLLYTPVNVPLSPGDNLTAVYTFYFLGPTKNTLGFWKLFSLAPPLGGDSYALTLVDEGGNSATFWTGITTPWWPPYQWRNAPVSSGIILELGTGTTPPSIEDFRLSNKVLEGRAGIGLVVDDGRVIFVTTVIPPSSYNVTEVGVALMISDGDGNIRRVLIARYLLPTVTQVTANKPITIAWVFKLP